MKYSIKGKLNLSDENDIIELINNYTLWKLVVERFNDLITGEPSLAIEVWLDSEKDKTALFNELKIFVDSYGEYINWHKCTHDEENPVPCVIEEEYRKE